jgi:hypothetical protein
MGESPQPPACCHTMPRAGVCLPVAQRFEAWTGKETATLPEKPFRSRKVAQKWNSRIISRLKTRLFSSGKQWIMPLFYRHLLKWWLGAELNRRHKDFQSSALPTELPSQTVIREALPTLAHF